MSTFIALGQSLPVFSFDYGFPLRKHLITVLSLCCCCCVSASRLLCGVHVLALLLHFFNFVWRSGRVIQRGSGIGLLLIRPCIIFIPIESSLSPKKKTI